MAVGDLVFLSFVCQHSLQFCPVGTTIVSLRRVAFISEEACGDLVQLLMGLAVNLLHPN